MPKTDRRWSALALIVTAQFMVILDVAIVNVALPSIKSDLHFSDANLQWVITAYAILFGGALLLGGRLADLLGRRRLFISGLALTPLLLDDSRADAAHRHFDLPGAASITAGLMLLVYALTRATSDGWGAPLTIALLAASAALVAAFVVIELRSRWPLLPLRIFP